MKKLKPGWWYRIVWIDATSNDEERADKAHLATVEQVVIYLRTEDHHFKGRRYPYHVFAMRNEPTTPDQSGWIAIPANWVVEMEPWRESTPI